MNKKLDQTVEAIDALASQISGLHKQAIAIYEPEVEAIIRGRSHDVRRIEQTLDRLLDCAGDDTCLQLYRRLCRHYWDIDPVATAEYIHFYRQTWDTESLPETQA